MFLPSVFSVTLWFVRMDSSHDPVAYARSAGLDPGKLPRDCAAFKSLGGDPKRPFGGPPPVPPGPPPPAPPPKKS